MAPDDEKDPKVKELLERDLDKPLTDVVNEVTAAELERWFGLPSYQQVDEGEVVLAKEDPDVVAVRERRAKAIEAVDPAWVEAHKRRTDEPLDDLLVFKERITLRVDPDIGLFDHKFLENRQTISEPRSFQRPEDIEEQMESAAPQALLRDLHRPELEFEKLFESIDMAAEQKIDIVAEVNAAMATNWKLPEFEIRPCIEARLLYAEITTERKRPWRDIPSRVNLPNRRVQE